MYTEGRIVWSEWRLFLVKFPTLIFHEICTSGSELVPGHREVDELTTGERSWTLQG
jgi:hypothetical protein